MKRVKVSINGKEYLLRTEGSVESLISIAHKINQKIEEILNKNEYVNIVDALTLIAINQEDQLMQKKLAFATLEKHIEAYKSNPTASQSDKNSSKDLQNEVQQLKAENEKIIAELNQLKKMQEKWLDKEKQLNQKLEKSIADNEQLLDEMIRIEGTEKTKHSKNLKDELDYANKLVAELTGENEILETEVIRLKNQGNSGKKEKQIGILEAQIEELKFQNSALSQRLTEVVEDGQLILG